MKNKTIFNYVVGMIEHGLGVRRTLVEDAICRQAISRFKAGGVNLEDCYKKPSHAKISAYLECESMWEECGVKQVCSSIVGYNCQSFSWAALWVDNEPDKNGCASVYIRYDTRRHCKLIEVCCVPYEWVE